MQRDLTSGKITGNLLKFASFAAMLQCGGYVGRGAVPWLGRTGRRGFFLYADDLFNLDLARALLGERRGFVHAVWEKRLRAFKVLYV